VPGFDNSQARPLPQVNSLASPTCFHCGLPALPNLTAEIDGQRRAFCCIGCQAVAQAIAGRGLGDFYRHRERPSAQAQLPGARFDAYDLPAVQEDFVEQHADGSVTANLSVGGIGCAACIWLIEKHLGGIPGVLQVQASASSHRAQIQLQPERLKISELFNALYAIGFTPEPLLGRAEQDLWQKDQRDYLLRLAVAGIGMMQAGMVAVALHAGDLQGMDPHWEWLLRWVNLLLTLPIMLYSAKPFFTGALRALRLRHLVNDVSISLALILAFSASVYATVTQSGDVYFDSVAMFAFFLLLGRYLEKRARYENFKTGARFQQLLPGTVNLVEKDGTVAVFPLKHLAQGGQVLVTPGAVFPCDGQVLDGLSEADESLLTGEANPCPKVPGDPVYAGTFNGATPLRVLAQAVGQGTRLAAIERLVQQAEQQRPQQVALADFIAARFVAAVLILASLTGAVWCWLDPSRAFWIALSVLVVSCPCALSLATPTVLTVAIGRLRQMGVLITGGQVFDVLHGVTRVVFDKTGTLTDGALRLVETRALAAIPSERINQIAATLELGSSHPIARAFAEVPSLGDMERRTSETGAGVSGIINGVTYRFGTPTYAWPEAPLAYPSPGLWLLLADDRHPLGWIRLEDHLRESSRPCIEQVRALGCEPMLLSGDRPENVAAVAETLGIHDWRGGLLPAEKLAQVRALQADGQRVLMVGDGINDLPVLSGADVSCAMGSATRLAQTKADCVLLGENLLQIPAALRLARQVRRTIKQNLTWAIVYNLCAIPLAAAGLVPPWLAAIGMSASSVVVVVNSLRVGRLSNQSGIHSGS
jgi:Cu2+-exporting ATPase